MALLGVCRGKLPCVSVLTAAAGRMLAMGHLLGYFAGTLDLRKYAGDRLGSSQFKQICVIASATIVSCSAVTCFCVQERALTARR